MSNDLKTDKERQSALLPAAFFGTCPRCDARTIFGPVLRSNPASFNEKCNHCDLDYSSFNVGDGPAAFLTFFMGGLIVTLALTLELSLYPPFWVHVILWVPLTIILTILSLRIAKGALLILEYRNKAKEVVVDDVKEGDRDNHMKGSDDA